MADSELEAIAKLVLRQQRLMGVMSEMLVDATVIGISCVEKCGRCSSRPVTVRHETTGMSACDRCASEMIVLASRNFIEACIASDVSSTSGDPSYWESLMSDDSWVDVENADRIRRVHEFCGIIDASSSPMLTQ